MLPQPLGDALDTGKGHPLPPLNFHHVSKCVARLSWARDHCRQACARIPAHAGNLDGAFCGRLFRTEAAKTYRPRPNSSILPCFASSINAISARRTSWLRMPRPDTRLWFACPGAAETRAGQIYGVRGRVNLQRCADPVGPSLPGWDCPPQTCRREGRDPFRPFTKDATCGRIGAMTTRFLPTQWRDWHAARRQQRKAAGALWRSHRRQAHPFALWTPAATPRRGNAPTPPSNPQAALYGKWRSATGTPKQPAHSVSIGSVGFGLRTGDDPFKHVGLFPEQAEFIAANLNEGDRFLNLFAYTGGTASPTPSRRGRHPLRRHPASRRLDSQKHGTQRA